MNVYWLEQTEADVPSGNDWLSANETACLSGLRFPKRRADWRLGRWTAKRALSIALDMPAHPQVLKKIDIRPAPSGAPEAFIDNQPANVNISLSHRDGTAICTVAASGVEMGCDLEVVEPRSDAFIADYFRVEEQALVAREFAAERPRLLALLWSGKESALKALRAGLRFDTRSVLVSPLAEPIDLNGWSPLQVRYIGGPDAGVRLDEGRVFHGWYQHADNIVRTVVSAPRSAPPILLKAAGQSFDISPDSARDCAFRCA